MDTIITGRDKILRLERIKTQRLQDLLRHYSRKNHQQRIKQLIKPPSKQKQLPSYFINQWRQKMLKKKKERTNNMGPKRIQYHLKF